MRLVIQNPKAAVFDDVFPDEHFALIKEFTQKENYTSLLTNQHWIKTWRLGDGLPMRGSEYKSDNKYEGPIEMVKLYVQEIARHCPDLCGKWSKFTICPYLYPRGTKISWHNDFGYTAAMIFYTHRHWGSTWGGELMIAETPEHNGIAELGKYAGHGPHLDHDWEDNFMNHYGTGFYVSPKPNRCVLTPAGVWHAINRVDPDAGDNTRSSLVVFFKS